MKSAGVATRRRIDGGGGRVLGAIEHREPHAPDDEETQALVAEIAELLDGRAVAAAESCTAGRVAAALATAEGAADFFRGGLVAYQVPVKQTLLGVSSTHVLNRRTAEEMARGAAELLVADVTVTTTGLAGGDPIDGVPVGTVFIGTFVNGVIRSAAHWFPGSPEDVCAAAASQALIDLRAALRDADGTIRADRSSAAVAPPRASG